MAHARVFETLIDLSEQESDEAAKALGHAIQANHQAREKLSLLQNYKSDYVRQLVDRLAAGLSGLEHRNYEQFLAGLERAIHQQDEVCQECQRTAARALDLWQASERKRLSFRTLGQRQLREKAREEARREQKRSDEHAARQRRQLH